MGGTYKAPDIAAANREAVMASIETFPLQREIEAASRIGAKVQVPIYKDGKETGQFRTVDFKDVSDIAQTRAIGQALADLAPIQAQRQLEAASSTAPSSRNSAEPSFRLLTLSVMALPLSMEDPELLVSIPSS
jgi:hypothetical protein